MISLMEVCSLSVEERIRPAKLPGKRFSGSVVRPPRHLLHQHFVHPALGPYLLRFFDFVTSSIFMPLAGVAISLGRWVLTSKAIVDEASNNGPENQSFLRNLPLS